MQTINMDECIILKENSEASLYDVGDGVILFDNHSKGNSMTAGFVEMLYYSVDILESNDDYVGLVLTNQNKHFVTGGDLSHFMKYIDAEDWSSLREYLTNGQQLVYRIKHSKKPVVATPFGMVLGGGCELSLQATKLIVLKDAKIGLVEPSLGLIPCALGTTEMLRRASEQVGKGPVVELVQSVKRHFKTIAFSKISEDGNKARKLGFLKATDIIVENKEELSRLAKLEVLNLVADGFSPVQETPIRVPGHIGYGTLLQLIQDMESGEFISEHDAYVSRKLAYVITGGDVAGGTYLRNKDLMKLEIDIFLELCKHKKTQDRIRYTLENRKPLRN